MLKDKLKQLNLKIEWKKAEDVSSTLIEKYSYVSEKEVLMLKFSNSDDIYYYNVPSSVFKSFLISESKGKFFHKKIRGHYPWMKEE